VLDARSAYDREAADPLTDLERLVLNDEDSGLASEGTAKTDQGEGATAEAHDAGQDTDSASAEITEEVSPESDEEDAEDAEDGEDSEDLVGLGERAQKRIHQLLKRAKDAEDALVAEKEARAALQAQVPPAAAKPAEKPLLEAGPVEVKTSPYAQRIQQLESLAELAEAHPEGVELADGKGGQKFFAPEELRNAQRNAQRELRGLSAQEAVWKAQEAQRFSAEVERNMGRARQKFTFFDDTTTAEHQMARQILQQAPELRRFQDWPVVLGILADGLVKLERESAAPAAPAAGTPGANGADKPRPTVTATTQGARKAPAAPRVGTGVANAPRSANATGQRARGLQSLIQAAVKGDKEAELAAIESYLS
jgi:hypothetical protein